LGLVYSSDSLKQAQEWIETERYKEALDAYATMSPSAERDLGILICKFELKKYDNIESEIKTLIDNVNKSEPHLYVAAQMLYAKYLVNTSRYEDALKIINKIKTNDNYYLGEKYNLLALMEMNENKFELSNQYYAQALKYLSISKERKYVIKKGLVYNNKAASYFYQSDFDNAEQWYQKALHEYEKFPTACRAKIAKTNYNLAIILYEKNQNYESLKLLEKALAIYKSVYGEQHSTVAECYGMLGSVYLYFNQLDKAIDYFNKDRNICINIYGEQNLNVAFSYLDCGMVYNQLKDYQLAKQNLEKSLSIRRAFLDENHEDIVENYLELINAYIGLNDINQAKVLCNKVLSIEQKLQENVSIRKAEVYMYLGMISKNEKKYTEAINYIKKSDALFIQLLGKNHKYHNTLYLLLSEIEFEQENISQAINYAVASFPYDKNDLFENILSKLQVYQLQFYKNKYSNQYWDNVLDTLKQKINVLRKENNFYFGEKSSLNKADIISKVCLFATELTFNLFQNSYKKKYIDDAFFFIEYNKANALLQKQEFVTNKQIDKNSLKILNDILNKTSELNQLDKNLASNKKKYANLEHELIQLKEKYELIQQKNETKSEKINQNISIAKLQQKLKRDEVYITYLENEAAIFRIAVSKNDMLFSKLIDKQKINKYVTELNNSIQSKNVNTKLAQLLYDVILPNKIIEDKKQIIFSADGFLHQLPFDVLQNKEKKYLIENYSTKYTFSSNIYFNEYNTHKFIYNNNVLAIAPEYDNTKYATLQNVEEINAIKKYFTTKPLLKQDATKNNYYKFAKAYRNIHLAAHTYIDSIVPLQSSIVLYDAKSADKCCYLNLEDLMRNQICADLVVLSACDGSFGKQNKGEGVLNFAWAIHYAGANNVLISQWKAADKATQTLMQKFYERLSKNIPISDALQQTKLDYMKNADAIGREPYYWSNFIVYATMNTYKFNFRYLYFALSLLLIVFIIIYIVKTKRK
jgi:CHAT domain-containing protein